VRRLLMMLMLVALTGACGGSKEGTETTSAPVTTNSADSRFAALNALPNSAAPAEIAAACEEHEVAALPPALRERCASAHYDVARKYVQDEDVTSARQAVDRARDEGMPAHRIAVVERELKDLEKKVELKEGMVRREEAAHKVTNVFQYRGLQVRTQLGGQYKENVTIEDPSFTSESAEQLRTDEYVLGPLREAGVKNVTFSDGNGYSTTVKLE
jgi:hypothetical protein